MPLTSSTNERFTKYRQQWQDVGRAAAGAACIASSLTPFSPVELKGTGAGQRLTMADAHARMASNDDESSGSDGETEPAKSFHRRVSTSKSISKLVS